VSPEDGADLVAIYRATARELPSATTDAAILHAASRTARRRRAVRNPAAWLALAAAVGGIAVLTNRSEPGDSPRSAIEARSYGRFEGSSRPFLLRETDAAGVGPGSTAFMQIAYFPEEK
jgi:hypothetical protein